MSQDHEQQCILILVEEPFYLSNNQNSFRIKLKEKFTQLGKGYSKWIEAKVKYIKEQRERRVSNSLLQVNFLPIEFLFDDYLVIQAMKSIRPKYSNLVRDLPFILNRKSLFELAFKEWFCDPLLQSSETSKSDLDIAHMLVQFQGRHLAFLSEECQSDKRIVLSAVKNDGWAYLYASEDLKNDPEIIMAAVKSDSITLEESVFERYPEIAVEYLVQHYNTSLSYLFKDKHVVLEAIKRNVNVYSNSNMKDELKKDREIILAIAPVNITLLDHVKGIDLLQDRDFCLQLVKINYLAFRYLSESIRNNDEEILLNCLQHDPSLLEQSELRNNKQFILKALNHDCKILPYIPAELIKDESFENFKENEKSESLQLEDDSNDMFMVGNYEENDEFIEEEEVKKPNKRKDFELLFKQNDRKGILEVIRNDASLMRFAKEDLLKDSQFAMECVMVNQNCIEYFPFFKNDKDFVLKVIDLGNFTNISLAESLVSDLDFKQKIADLILQRKVVFTQVPNFLTDNEEILLSSMKVNQYKFSYQQIPKNLIENREFVMKALKLSPAFYLAIDLNHDEEYRMAALKYHGLIADFSHINSQEEFDILLRERMNYAYGGGTFHLH
ncbi:predicted protein [Naegleria gruberi]|uniref:Predicted protein n=1 Tax=Naegleria gruberi TaxID=5762 RepID=D2VP49_NAEGR|nr:uncharacterized protein NAEGRDRAFT_70731 [Naegleria gruberi]EFC41370.1 predicted protein [Naegleria gruberi]|eukprot:XP_002674114.1 predicted protein [Naegleria gruberi strain NEG-M]